MKATNNKIYEIILLLIIKGKQIKVYLMGFVCFIEYVNTVSRAYLFAMTIPLYNISSFVSFDSDK